MRRALFIVQIAAALLLLTCAAAFAQDLACSRDARAGRPLLNDGRRL
jgi:hypothetical protein